jgi:hypothetical protein
METLLVPEMATAAAIPTHISFNDNLAAPMLLLKGGQTETL